MFKFLRIACALIAAALAAVCVLVGVFTESLWAAIGVAAGAALFFALCLLFKYLQEEQEEKAAKAQQAQSGEDAAQSGEDAAQNSEGAAETEVQPDGQDAAQIMPADAGKQAGAAAEADEQSTARRPQSEQNKNGQND